MSEGRLIVSGVVVSEVAGLFANAKEAARTLETLQAELEPMGLEGALGAGAAFRAYRQQGGKRDRIIADFLIGAHALTLADRLATRDRGFYRKYFAKLKVVEP
jgi:predicted nucleic acid-binding protein